MTSTPSLKVIPSTELKLAIKSWVEYNKNKYGDNWKEILAKEMTAQIPKEILDKLVNK